MHPKEERTVVIVKPDGVRRGLIGEIVNRFERRGLKIIALELFSATKQQIDDHYPKDEKWILRLGEKTLANYTQYGIDAKAELGTDDKKEIGLMVRGWLLDYMTSAPLVKMIVKGIHAVDMVRKISGPTMPAAAEMGTIRGDFSVDDASAANRDKRAIHNIVHASETPQEAEHEIQFWFAPEEVHDYKRAEDDIMF
ncbi:MAG: nucleoside-diphosphate kinase [Candidatus Wildermuthbacteria bacterium RIFCSPHIGHO2_02_FULL_49_9]|uniref:nucleoside-diphosphate kinase n=2 Tax=Candidatus Wildermuthiibacteriota TaxID=1817923 RepID=A0A1G2QYU8_9BACT|nr:MAG: nucleoside-diphosphate kinase [Candidatus Wildermuthbacteria bacterium RIFCSPHIGHO2_01_FULL_49_22b]OHA70472.1 MAG: nucleoside-diphosphate kinase [Candidatus Wildermuthbacteria bacterium RIFCSPHIGHO2_02_FULL_49_9]